MSLYTYSFAFLVYELPRFYAACNDGIITTEFGVRAGENPSQLKI
jgi:hypothetical protein